MSDRDRGEFLSKWDRGPVTAYQKWCVGKTYEEIEEARTQRLRDVQEESMRKYRAERPWLKYREGAPLDEQRDQGLHNLRTANDGPGDYAWDDYLGEDAQPVID